MGRFRDNENFRKHWLALADGGGVKAGMTDVHPVHTAEEMIDAESHFEVWPLNEGSGCPVSDLNEPHLHDFYAIQYVREGRGSHVIDFQPYEIVPNSLYFVSPQQLHMWRPESEVEGLVMAFTEDFLTTPDAPFGTLYDLNFFHSLSNVPFLHADNDKATIILDLLQKISHEFAEKNDGYVSVVRAFFHILMVNLQRMFADRIERENTLQEPSLARRFKRMVSEKYASQMSIQEYADILGVSVSRLNAVIKETTKQTPGQIVRNELVLAAKRMLAHSDMNVAEICFKLSFEDPSYFGRFFKREAGMPPSAFREQVQEKYLLSAK